ncbi:MAG: SDR family oxidoreductase [Anaerolineales bacterium]|jgi:NAD(P)-dependent dehydrogenase (short-subunit alcohol dehydrogenase family)|nr:SDR family oxidoreductase [Anaerolineales bacterium]
MNLEELKSLYDFSDRTILVTGGTGVLASEMVRALVGCNANVVILGRKAEAAKKLISEFSSNTKGRALYVHADVVEADTLLQAKEIITAEFGVVDILINAAGGNHTSATTKPDLSFFDLPLDALRYVGDLNLLGTILPCQIFGRDMAERGEGVILNVSSMNAYRPITRIPAYSASKAAVSNFTQWLAVHMAQNYSPKIRVNAIAPGFFLTDQNRFLLTDKDTGELTPRGQSILTHTPMNRFGTPDDLLGATMWLISPASAFVTGAVIPIDGGFSAFSGV